MLCTVLQWVDFWAFSFSLTVSWLLTYWFSVSSDDHMFPSVFTTKQFHINCRHEVHSCFFVLFVGSCRPFQRFTQLLHSYELGESRDKLYCNLWLNEKLLLIDLCLPNSLCLFCMHNYTFTLLTYIQCIWHYNQLCGYPPPAESSPEGNKTIWYFF